jgi:multiple sugar transport system ATP-binding protein
LSNLDAKLRVQMRGEIARLQRRLHTTTVYVTHDQTEAMTLGDRVVVMLAGVAQQIGTPQELYDRPVNLFVAGFIGSPAMNFLPARVEDGALHTALGTVPLPDRLRSALESRQAARDLILGIRPEAFEDSALVPEEKKPHGVSFRAKIDVVESMGSENYVYFDLDVGEQVTSRELEELAQDSGRADAGGHAEQVVARLDAESEIRSGADAQLWADTQSIHVFDPQSGENLALA